MRGTVAPREAAAYRAWRRPLQRRVSAGSAGYAVYVGVMVAAVYGSMAWSALASLGFGGSRPDGAGATGLPGVMAAGMLAAIVLVAAVLVAAVVVARAGAPLWVSRREAVHVLGGQFRPAVVLRRRGIGLLATAAALGAFTAVALTSGGRPGVTVASWAVWAAATASALVAVAALAQATLAHATAPGAGVRRWWPVAVAVVGVAGAVIGAVTGAGGVRIAVAVVVVPSWWVVLSLVPGRLDPDDVAARGARTAGVAAGMAAGDTRSAAQAFPPRLHGPRRGLPALVPSMLVRRAPILARDLLGQRRRPALTVVGVVAALAGAWLVLAASTVLGVVGGALLLYCAAGALGRGLSAFLAQPVPGGLLPGRGRMVLARHAALPGLAFVAAYVIAGTLTLGTMPFADAVEAVALGALALAARAWSMSGSTVPAAAYTPVVTPLGDLAVMNVAAYMLRGWLVVGGAAWLAGIAHDGQGWMLPAAGAVFCAARTVRAAER